MLGGEGGLLRPASSRRMRRRDTRCSSRWAGAAGGCRTSLATASAHASRPSRASSKNPTASVSVRLGLPGLEAQSTVIDLCLEPQSASFGAGQDHAAAPVARDPPGDHAGPGGRVGDGKPHVAAGGLIRRLPARRCPTPAASQLGFPRSTAKSAGAIRSTVTESLPELANVARRNTNGRPGYRASSSAEPSGRSTRIALPFRNAIVDGSDFPTRRRRVGLRPNGTASWVWRATSNVPASGATWTDNTPLSIDNGSASAFGRPPPSATQGSKAISRRQTVRQFDLYDLCMSASDEVLTEGRGCSKMLRENRRRLADHTIRRRGRRRRTPEIGNVK